MNKSQLKREGEKWVTEGIITKEQLDEILLRYVDKKQSNILILFAALLISIGILTFAFSDWSGISAVLRVMMMVVCMVILYVVGNHFFQKNRENLYGISFIILGYIFFGATLLLIINVYSIVLFNIWPLILWSIVGLFLYVLYENRYLFIIGILITTFSQIYSGLAFSSFNFIIFFLYIFGYFHYVYHRPNKFISYLFAIGLSIQTVMLSVIEFEQYYWFIIFALSIYLLAQIIQKVVLKRALFFISIWSILIFRMYESFLLQEQYFIEEIVIQPMFFIIWAVVLITVFGLKFIQAKKIELIDLLLFLPVFFIPMHYIIILIFMFIFSVYWLTIGFQRNMDEKIIVGIVSFIISTFTLYAQFAWETLNRSLFFLIGGILLFVLSYFLDRQRKKNATEGEDTK